MVGDARLTGRIARCRSVRQSGLAPVDKDLIAQHVGNVIIQHDRIEVESRRDPDGEEPGSAGKLVIPFSPNRHCSEGDRAPAAEQISILISAASASYAGARMASASGHPAPAALRRGAGSW